MLLMLGGGFPTAAEWNPIQAFLNKVKRWGIVSGDRSIDDILDEINYDLLIKCIFQPLFAAP